MVHLEGRGKDMKYLILLFMFTIHINSLIGQDSSSTEIPQIFILSTIKCKDFVYVHPKIEEKKIKYSHIHLGTESIFFITHKDSVESKLKNVEKVDIKYLVFDNDCYIDLNNSDALYTYIISIAPDSISSRLKVKHPSRWGTVNYLSSNRKEYFGYATCDLNDSEFLVVLMSVKLLNEIGSQQLPVFHRLKYEKTMNGLFVKVLIPL